MKKILFALILVGCAAPKKAPEVVHSVQKPIVRTIQSPPRIIRIPGPKITVHDTVVDTVYKWRCPKHKRPCRAK